MKAHLKHMIVGGAAILAALVLFGVDWRVALQWAVILACPVMMMVMMAGGHGHGHGHAGTPPQDAGAGQIGPDRERIDDPSAGHQHGHGSH
ncbi:MAG: hypothetical protein BGO38_16185 [Cellulomonas sp. 73-145]|uniref:DUF2933 domain-containing protein n=1 Tax=Cellulomonas sp. 73-145 TaxID=1895739 RepID=UPI0009270951|nr:DUF2933 domain-containing protein [Cellulomonas sp. 73-145]OJV58878.1 MAG: hypothetical protein BGO38_16185 [Cellulomonas sp. 73-145]